MGEAVGLINTLITNQETKIKPMGKNPTRLPPKVGLCYLKCFGAMQMTMNFMTAHEQHHTQHICVWFYKHGTSRVQTRIRMQFTLFTKFFSASDDVPENKLFSVSASGAVTNLICEDQKISHVTWHAVQVGPHSVF